MIWIVSMFLAVIVSGALVAIGFAARGAAQPGAPERGTGSLLMVGGVALFTVWVGIHTALSSVKPIEAGHVGVVYQFGEIVGQKPEGLQFIMPWQTMRTANVRVQRHRFDNVTSFSAETQDVFVVATVNYSIS
ncbi:MAG TPA: SPFH domain-containing protein, partial [Tepidiformaceae bacterium]|nr:SPFH domain-containing protein [Tepidiformaceae bacterium]